MCVPFTSKVEQTNAKVATWNLNYTKVCFRVFKLVSDQTEDVVGRTHQTTSSETSRVIPVSRVS